MADDHEATPDLVVRDSVPVGGRVVFDPMLIFMLKRYFGEAFKERDSRREKGERRERGKGRAG